MAEAVVNGASTSRFFCHKCNIEIERLLPDYTCPRCACGFIEELEGGGNDSGSGTHTIEVDVFDRELGDLDLGYASEAGPLIEIILGLSNSAQATGTSNRNSAPSDRRRVNWSRSTPDSRRSSSSRGRQEMTPMSVENFLQDFIFNLSGAGLGQPITQDGQPPVFNRLFLGNPGDYVWGRDGLDAIVTQLLNQMDGTGPPPLPRKQIDEIPTTNVTQAQVDCKLQCSVCWEDFKVGEPVRQLRCQHLYHAPCIVPWLELHGTCPICRQSLGDQNSTETSQLTVRPNLAAPVRAATESNSSRTSSTSSSAGNNSSNNSTSGI